MSKVFVGTRVTHLCEWRCMDCMDMLIQPVTLVMMLGKTLVELAIPYQWIQGPGSRLKMLSPELDTATSLIHVGGQ